MEGKDPGEGLSGGGGVVIDCGLSISIGERPAGVHSSPGFKLTTVPGL